MADRTNPTLKVHPSHMYISVSVSQLLLYKGVLNIPLPLICCACKGTEVCKELRQYLNAVTEALLIIMGWQLLGSAQFMWSPLTKQGLGELTHTYEGIWHMLYLFWRKCNSLIYTSNWFFSDRTQMKLMDSSNFPPYYIGLSYIITLNNLYFKCTR